MARDEHTWTEGAGRQISFATKPERPRLLEAGGELQSPHACEYRQPGVVFDQNNLACQD